MVILENFVKQSAPVTSGVTQDSLLDPVLFVLFIESYCVCEEKDLGLVILDKLTWDTHLRHLHLTTAKANNLVRLLKRSCPMVTKVAVREAL